MNLLTRPFEMYPYELALLVMVTIVIGSALWWQVVQRRVVDDREMARLYNEEMTKTMARSQWYRRSRLALARLTRYEYAGIDILDDPDELSFWKPVETADVPAGPPVIRTTHVDGRSARPEDVAEARRNQLSHYRWARGGLRRSLDPNVNRN